MRKLLVDLYRGVRRILFAEGVVNRKGTGIVNLIDVGSVERLPMPWYEKAYEIQHLLNFEPRDEPEKGRYTLTMNCGLWESGGEEEFYIYKGYSGSGSSLLEQNYEYVKENFEELKGRGPKYLADTWFERSELVSVDRIKCRKLDDVLDELKEPFPYHFLKIDAQGAEYQILKGAERFLKEDCLGLHLELFVIPLYKGVHLLPEVERYLDGLGFELVKKFPPHGSFDCSHDCIFLKRGAKGEVIDKIRELYAL